MTAAGFVGIGTMARRRRRAIPTFSARFSGNKISFRNADGPALDATVSERPNYNCVYSATLADLATGPVNQLPPVIIDNGDGTFSARNGLWANDPAAGTVRLTGQWLHDGTVIPDFKANTYTQKAADAGATLSYRQTATDGNGNRSQVSNGIAIPSAGLSYVELPAIVAVSEPNTTTHTRAVDLSGFGAGDTVFVFVGENDDIASGTLTNNGGPQAMTIEAVTGFISGLNMTVLSYKLTAPGSASDQFVFTTSDPGRGNIAVPIVLRSGGLTVAADTAFVRGNDTTVPNTISLAAPAAPSLVFAVGMTNNINANMTFTFSGGTLFKDMEPVAAVGEPLRAVKYSLNVWEGPTSISEITGQTVPTNGDRAGIGIFGVTPALPI